MDRCDAKTMLTNAVKYFRDEDRTEAYGLILEQFDVDEINGEAVAVPVSVAQVAKLPEWPNSRDRQAVTVLVNRLQQEMELREFPFRSCMFLIHKKGVLDLVFGTERVKLSRMQKEVGGLQNVSLSFDEYASGCLPVFKSGDAVSITASSAVKGWVYLFCVDADMHISPIYPTEGSSSNIRVSQNYKVCITDRINEEIRKASPYGNLGKVSFAGRTSGRERIVALVIDAEAAPPITISHVRDRFPLSFLFGHEVSRSKGVGFVSVNSENDFTSVSPDRIAIGTLDYSFKAS